MWFHLSRRERWAVRHLSFTLKAGEVVALCRRERRRQDHAGEAAHAL